MLLYKVLISCYNFNDVDKSDPSEIRPNLIIQNSFSNAKRLTTKTINKNGLTAWGCRDLFYFIVVHFSNIQSIEIIKSGICFNKIQKTIASGIGDYDDHNGYTVNRATAEVSLDIKFANDYKKGRIKFVSYK